MNVGGSKALTDAVKASGGQVGPNDYWMDVWKQGTDFSGIETFYRNCKANGAQAMVLFWYWGDDISRAAIRDGVMDQHRTGIFKTKAEAAKLADAIASKAKLVGIVPMVVIEHEFTKGDVDLKAGRSEEFAA